MKSGRFAKNHSLAEEIQSIVRERILRGEYSAGQRIKESQLAQDLMVSRTPVREAFKQLEKEGLIENIPNRGSFALAFTRQDISDIYAVRAAVEVLAAEWAATRITENEIRMLQDVLERMEFYSGKQDSKKVMELNASFHGIIYNASGSRILAQILKSYQEYVQQTRKATVYCVENLEAILEEHRNILGAIRSRDGKAAAESIKAHLSNSRKRAEQILKL